MPVFEGDAAEDQSGEHQNERQIEGGQKRCIDDREGAPEYDTGCDQPGLVAVPNRGDGVHHRVAPRAAASSAAYDADAADAEIEAVEEHVEQRADRENGHPVENHGYSPGAKSGEFGRTP